MPWRAKWSIRGSGACGSGVRRRTVKGQVDGREAQARGRGVGSSSLEWYTASRWGVTAGVCAGGRAGACILWTAQKLEVPLDSGHYECSGVVKNDDGSLARGYKLATIRTLLDTAGVFTQVAVAPIQVHDVEVCRSMLLSSPTLRVGDLLLEDNGFMDGALISALKRTRQVDVIVPLRSNMVAFDDAVRLAEMTGKWQPHPSRAAQQIAFRGRCRSCVGHLQRAAECVCDSILAYQEAPNMPILCWSPPIKS